MGGLLQYWNLSGRHQLFGLQSPSQGCSVGSGISSSDRSISNCIYIVDIPFATFRCPKKRRGHGVCQTSSPPAPALRLLLTWPIHTGCLFSSSRCHVISSGTTLLRSWKAKEWSMWKFSPKGKWCQVRGWCSSFTGGQWTYYLRLGKTCIFHN